MGEDLELGFAEGGGLSLGAGTLLAHVPHTEAWANERVLRTRDQAVRSLQVFEFF